MFTPLSPVVYRIGAGFSGFGLMVLELTAARVVAPLVGTSIYTWTSVIGVTLLGLAIGAYVGGRIADKNVNPNMLSGVCFGAAFFVACIPILARFASVVVFFPLPVLVVILLLATTLFFFPATLLGMIFPMLLKQYVKEWSELGKEYGTLSMLWSVGSIVGVFATGFLFVDFLGTVRTLLILSGILVLIGLVFLKKQNIFTLIGLLFVIGAYVGFPYFLDKTLSAHVLYDKDTSYVHASVVDTDVPEIGQSRILFLDIGTHNIVSASSTEISYIDVAEVLPHIMKPEGSLLVLGGGAYEIPEIVSKIASGTKTTVMELDPAVTEIAKEFFSVPPQTTTVTGDARFLLARSTTTYDVIVGDAFNTFMGIPWHLLTKEFLGVVDAHLSPEGSFVINIISAREGESAGLYKSVSATLQSIFPEVVVMAFGNRPATYPENLVLIARKHPKEKPFLPNESLVSILKNKVPQLGALLVRLPKGGKILTDDFAPTDALLRPVMAQELQYSVLLYAYLTGTGGAWLNQKI